MEFIHAGAVKDELLGHAQYTANENAISRFEVDACGVTAIFEGVVHDVMKKLVKAMSSNSIKKWYQMKPGPMSHLLDAMDF